MKKFIIWTIVVIFLVVGGWFILPQYDTIKNPVTWQRLAMPGELSKAHSFLDQDCSECHIPVRGVEDAACIACHANNESLLQRQPTAFHSSIGNCAKCHLEHAGRQSRLNKMDHNKLAVIGLKILRRQGNTDSGHLKYLNKVSQWMGPRITHKEDIASVDQFLQCSSCHSNKDPHQSFFGKECADCHETSRWSIPAFRHPSPRSTDCAQCHQAPPSHYMMHFEMISETVAGESNATVSECFKCHQTTSWNDIQGVGIYKHH